MAVHSSCLPEAAGPIAMLVPVGAPLVGVHVDVLLCILSGSYLLYYVWSEGHMLNHVLV